MWKDLANNQQLENSHLIRLWVNCNNCQNIGEKRTIWKFTNDSMISQVQLMWKDLANNAQFENSQMIGWQVNCDECRKIWGTTHNLKIHKWCDDKSIAMNVERFGEQRTIWNITNDRMTSWLQWHTLTLTWRRFPPRSSLTSFAIGCRRRSWSRNRNKIFEYCSYSHLGCSKFC